MYLYRVGIRTKMFTTGIMLDTGEHLISNMLIIIYSLILLMAQV